MPRKANGKFFTSEYQPNNKCGGRKPAPWKTFVEAINQQQTVATLGKKDYEGIMGYLLSCNKEQLMEMAKRSDIPVAIIAMIKAIKADMDNGDTKMIDKLMDRTFGKAEIKASVETNSVVAVAQIDLESLSDEQLAVLSTIGQGELKKTE